MSRQHREDAWSNPSGEAWVRHVVSDMAPQLADSALCISIAPSPTGKWDKGDVKYWVELGASIMFDKPIIVVVMSDQQLPAKLVQVADEIVRLPGGVNAEGSDELAAAIRRVTERLKGATE